MSQNSSSLEEWNPPKEEYYSVSFNSYNQGPGANLPLECLPAFSGDSEVVRSRTIRVKNLPVGITEVFRSLQTSLYSYSEKCRLRNDVHNSVHKCCALYLVADKRGLRNLFEGCGEVLGAQRLHPRPEYPDKTIGFVDFRTTKDALEAISSFHDQPPFYLKVSISNMSLSDRWRVDSRVKGELDDIRQSIEQERRQPTCNGPLPVGVGRGRGVLSYECSSREDLKSIHVDVGPRPGEQRVCSSSSGKSSQSSNSLNLVETCILADNGDHRSKDENIRVLIKPNARGEQVRTVVVQNVVDHLPEKMCVYCCAHSEFLCPVCKAPYCSIECQVEDWPAHKGFCKPKGLLPSPPEEAPEKAPQKDKDPSSPVPSSRKSCPDKEKGTFARKQDDQRNNRSSAEPAHTQPAMSKPVPRMPTPAEPVSTSAQPAASLQSNMEEKVLHVAQRKLPSYKTDMVLVWRTLDGLFLHQQSLAEELQAMMGALNAWVRSHSPPPPSTIVYSKGDYVCALFSEDSIWYRGQVLKKQSLDGTYLVLFIDFGNKEWLPASSLRSLPSSFAEKPLFVFCVVPQNVPTESFRLAALLQQEPFAAVQVGTTQAGLPVVQLERKDGTCLNDVISRELHKVPKETYLERPLPTERTMALITHVADVDGLVYLQQCSLGSELMAMMSELNSSVPTTPLPALSVGDMACARNRADELWYRVRVLSTPEGGKCKVSFVDFGYDDFVPLPNIRALPQKMSNIQLFATSVALQGVKTINKESASELLYVKIEFAVVDSSSQPCKVKLFAGDQCLNDLIE